MSIYWLIDGSYMYKSVKKLEEKHGKISLDYLKLRQKIENELESKVTAYYFNATPNPQSDEQNSFHNWLKTGPGIRIPKLYELKKKKNNCPNCKHKFTRYVQKGVDVGIATHALKYHPKYETLILSTGDGDFLDAIKYLKEELEKRIMLVGFNGSISPDILPYADEKWFIDEFIDEVKDTRHLYKPFEDIDSVVDDE